MLDSFMNWITWNPNLFAAICWLAALVIMIYLAYRGPQMPEDYDDE